MQKKVVAPVKIQSQQQKNKKKENQLKFLLSWKLVALWSSSRALFLARLRRQWLSELPFPGSRVLARALGSCGMASFMVVKKEFSSPLFNQLTVSAGETLSVDWDKW